MLSLKDIKLTYLNAYSIQKILFGIAKSVADAAHVNPNGIKTLLVSGSSTFFIKVKPVFSNGPRSRPNNSPNCIILDTWVADNFTLADELFAKALRSIETCLLVSNVLCRKLISSLELHHVWWKIQSYFSIIFYSWF